MPKPNTPDLDALLNMMVWTENKRITPQECAPRRLDRCTMQQRTSHTYQGLDDPQHDSKDP